MKVERTVPLISPAYKMGQSEVQVSTRWRTYWDELCGWRSKQRAEQAGATITASIAVKHFNPITPRPKLPPIYPLAIPA